MNNLEEQFVDAFIEHGAAAKIVGSSHIILREIRSASGVPDILIIRSNDMIKLTAFYKQFNNFRFKHSHVQIIKHLNKKSFLSGKLLAEKLGFSVQYTTKLLLELQREDLTISNSKGWKLTQNLDYPNVDIISLEFKLHDWQSALKQGFRYKKLATKSYVVMPQQKYDLLDSKRENFEAYGVGLATFSEANSKLSIMCKPKKSRPKNVSYTSTLQSIHSAAISHSSLAVAF